MYHILICDDEQDIVNALKISDESGLQTVRGQHRSAGP